MPSPKSAIAVAIVMVIYTTIAAASGVHMRGLAAGTHGENPVLQSILDILKLMAPTVNNDMQPCPTCPVCEASANAKLDYCKLYGEKHCGDHGTCHNNDDYTGYTCHCDRDYSGTYCDKVDRCSIKNNKCNSANTLKCKNKHDTDDDAEEDEKYECICKEGWKGDHCSVKASSGFACVDDDCETLHCPIEHGHMEVKGVKKNKRCVDVNECDDLKCDERTDDKTHCKNVDFHADADMSTIEWDEIDHCYSPGDKPCEALQCTGDSKCYNNAGRPQCWSCDDLDEAINDAIKAEDVDLENQFTDWRDENDACNEKAST